MEYIIVFITASNEDEAGGIARKLVEEKLAACVNIIRDIRSVYMWKGKIEDDTEVLMIVKTRKEHFEKLRDVVTELHSYEVPEVISLPLIAGSEPYLAWLKDVTG
ncbi:MAG: divalent-cation tolerance protein CutA [Nitrospirota bacterium]|nr:MAG: divalent-cation tolerance protein CutA [Nitrospirota bacterium]